MGGLRRHVIVLGVLTGALAIAALLGGAQRGAAGTSGTICAGKPICLSVTTQDFASRSDVSDHFLADSFVLSYNPASNSTLVNISITVTWDDGATTTSAYRSSASDGRCIQPSLNVNSLTCTGPSSLRPGDGPFSFGPLVFRTATNLAASATNVTVRASAKEQTTPDKKGGGANVASVSVSGSTSYEGSPDQDLSLAGGGLNVTLSTANLGAQHSLVPLANKTSLDVATLSETDCPVGVCLGQVVTVFASNTNPFNLQIYYTGPLPPGLTENNLVVVHDTTSFTTACSGALFAPPAVGQALPCRRVSISRSGPGDPRVIVDVWDTHNGDFRWG